MEKHGRSSRSPESESSQGSQLVVIHSSKDTHHPSSSTSQKEMPSDQYECQLPDRDMAPEK